MDSIPNEIIHEIFKYLDPNENSKILDSFNMNYETLFRLNFDNLYSNIKSIIESELLSKYKDSWRILYFDLYKFSDNFEKIVEILYPVRQHQYDLRYVASAKKNSRLSSVTRHVISHAILKHSFPNIYYITELDNSEEYSQILLSTLLVTMFESKQMYTLKPIAQLITTGDLSIITSFDQLYKIFKIEDGSDTFQILIYLDILTHYKIIKITEDELERIHELFHSDCDLFIQGDQYFFNFRYYGFILNRIIPETDPD